MSTNCLEKKSITGEPYSQMMHHKCVAIHRSLIEIELASFILMSAALQCCLLKTFDPLSLCNPASEADVLLHGKSICQLWLIRLLKDLASSIWYHHIRQACGKRHGFFKESMPEGHFPAWWDYLLVGVETDVDFWFHSRRPLLFSFFGQREILNLQNLPL